MELLAKNEMKSQTEVLKEYSQIKTHPTAHDVNTRARKQDRIIADAYMMKVAGAYGYETEH